MGNEVTSPTEWIARGALVVGGTFTETSGSFRLVRFLKGMGEEIVCCDSVRIHTVHMFGI